MAIVRNKIIKPNLILCEGEDDLNFMIQYITHLQKTDDVFDNFQAIPFGGNENLLNFLSKVRAFTGFGDVLSMLILRDAEHDFSNAVQKIQSALKNNGFPMPSEPNMIAKNDGLKIAFTLFPSLSNEGRNGTLEDLFWDNLSENGVDILRNDIESYLGKLTGEGRDIRRPHKSKLHTYFSVTDDYVSMKIGEAAKAGAFDFDCAPMDSLKELMLEMIKD